MLESVWVDGQTKNLSLIGIEQLFRQGIAMNHGYVDHLVSVLGKIQGKRGFGCAGDAQQDDIRQMQGFKVSSVVMVQCELHRFDSVEIIVIDRMKQTGKILGFLLDAVGNGGQDRPQQVQCPDMLASGYSFDMLAQFRLDDSIDDEIMVDAGFRKNGINLFAGGNILIAGEVGVAVFELGHGCIDDGTGRFACSVRNNYQSQGFFQDALATSD